MQRHGSRPSPGAQGWHSAPGKRRALGRRNARSNWSKGQKPSPQGIPTVRPQIMLTFRRSCRHFWTHASQTPQLVIKAYLEHGVEEICDSVTHAELLSVVEGAGKEEHVEALRFEATRLYRTRSVRRRISRIVRGSKLCVTNTPLIFTCVFSRAWHLRAALLSSPHNPRDLAARGRADSI
jgi:hypothetical protein